MPRLSVSLLGTFQATLDGEPVSGFESDKVRALLAYLMVETATLHRRERLAGLLWPDRPERSARNNLRHALSVLRRAVGDRSATHTGCQETLFLLITNETVQFNRVSDYWFDAEAFESLLDADPANRTDLHDQSICRQLEKGVALYRGGFLDGFSVKGSPAFEEWSLLVRDRLQRQASMALLRLVSAYEARGEGVKACKYAQLQVELEPWNEEAHQRLMRILALNGQRSAAMVQYEACRDALRDELDVEPGEETRCLYERIRSGQVDRLAQVPLPPTRKGGELPRHNLPASITPFIGREALLTAVRERLQDSDCRLLTLVGPGGSGKTCLALEAARVALSTSASQSYPDGIYFVSLAPLRAIDAIVPTVAQALGLSLDLVLSTTGTGTLRPLLDYLHQRQLLLILDNLEHLLTYPVSGKLDGAQVVVEVLRAAPAVTILATSRARMNVQGEHLLLIPGMEVPPDPVAGRSVTEEKLVSQYSAVQLFLDSTRRLQPEYQPTVEDLPHIARICRQVSGMPLAILLAAAWMRILSPAEISGELAQGVDFLQTDWHGVPARQHSMRAVFDHSYGLLSEGQREILCGLSVFRGSFTRQAAQEVTGASLHELAALVDMSLLQRTFTDRYTLHALLREYAAEKLGASEERKLAAYDRHAAYYAAALERWAEDLKGNRDRAAQIEIEEALEDVRAAWGWAIERHAVTWLGQGLDGLRLFCAFCLRYTEGEAISGAAAEALCARETEPFAHAETLRVVSRLLSTRPH